MRYIFLVAWREYAENARTKGFWIGLCMFPLLILISVKASVLIEKHGTPIRYYLLIDQSGKYESNLVSHLKTFRRHSFSPANDQEAAPYARAVLPSSLDTNGDLSALASELKPYLRHEKTVLADGRNIELYAAILIPRDIDEHIIRPHSQNGKGKHDIEYWSVNLADTTLRDQAQRVINDEIHHCEYAARGLDVAAVSEVEETYAPFASLDPTKESGKETVSTVDVLKQWAPSGFVYLLWVSIFGITQMLLNNIIEEKSNRIIEVLLSSVTPGELMMGKLFGIAAVGLTMVAVWITALMGTLQWKAGGDPGVAMVNKQAVELLQTLKTSHMIPMFAVYFLMGYLMYASFILALGSVCNTIKEAQNYMAMIVMIMMVPLITMPFIPRDPNGTLARVLSWIPVYTPFTMMNRVNASPPMIDVVGTMILLVVSTLVALWMAGKIFRIGILRTGQPPRIVEMLRWLKG